MYGEQSMSVIKFQYNEVNIGIAKKAETETHADKKKGAKWKQCRLRQLIEASYNFFYIPGFIWRRFAINYSHLKFGYLKDGALSN